MENLVRDLRFGIRMLMRTPLLSITAILTFGLGVGATTFIYSTTLVFDNLPVQDSERLMVVRRTTVAGEGSLRFHDYTDLRERQTVFQDLAAGYSGTLNLAGVDGPPARVLGGFYTANAFDGLGIEPILGRGFQPGDDASGAPLTLLLGFDTWQSYFAGDRRRPPSCIDGRASPPCSSAARRSSWPWWASTESWIPPSRAAFGRWALTVILILTLTCVTASLFPALKAVRVNPVEALRAE